MMLSLNLPLVWAETSVTPTADEMHLLIDVSGSMKQNDPGNLRVDASKLWLNLLPDGQRVSVWLFAESTERLTNTDHVDAAWKTQAVKDSGKIHTRGRYTDIEGAIKTLLDKAFTGEGQRHLLLLTDGRVDTSSDIMVSADSRERILSEWIPQLKQRNIQVHTIALSNQADVALLQALAGETGGASESAESAEQLQRLFLKMLKQTAPFDQLPLQNNHFNVDASVKEFSVVVFKAPKAPLTRLIAPNQQIIDQHSQSASWLETGGYDLITVKQPQPGEWSIDAASDPDNQVMILTDLKLAIEPLPLKISPQQQLTLKVHLSEKNQAITRKDFLELVQWALVVDQQAPLSLEAVPGEPGFFTQALNGLSPGKHSLALRADAKTFQREISRDFEVQAMPLMLETVIPSGTRDIELNFSPDPALLDIASLQIKVNQKYDAQAPAQFPVMEHAGRWSLRLPSWPQGVKGELSFEVEAKTLDGQVLKIDLPLLAIDETRFESSPKEHTQTQAIDSDHESADTSTAVNESIDWKQIIAVVLGVNVLVGLIGWWGYRMMRRYDQVREQQLLERLG